jgi:hypothetical protein
MASTRSRDGGHRTGRTGRMGRTDARTHGAPHKTERTTEVKFFLDTADLAEIEEAASWGVLAGVTTNPTLYQRVGGKLAGFHDHLKRICEICEGPVSGETVGLTRDEIVREGEELAALAPNIIVKVPVIPEGLAKENGTPIVHSHQLDKTVAETLERVVTAVTGDGA